MMSVVLVSGGAGFIGQHLCRVLLTKGYRVRVLDNFTPQVHGSNIELASDLRPYVELVRGDVRDRNAVIQACTGVACVIHLAAETGTGQSMYEIDRYFSVNVQGTAVLLDVLQNHEAGKNVRSVIVASSRAVYGEGTFQCQEHGIVYPDSRDPRRLSCGEFEPICPVCGSVVGMVATEESAPFKPVSIYGLTKQVAEQAVLMFARRRGINGFALRYQNVYGPGQSLKNPYTGILAVFSTLARQRQPIEVYEDGLESRDFVFVEDAMDATIRAVEFSGDFVGALNIGSGVATSVNKVASEINDYFGAYSPIRVSGAFRIGDIRHNKASTIRAQSVLGFSSSVAFSEGVRRFLTWVQTQELEDKTAYERSVAELAARGLMGNQSGS